MDKNIAYLEHIVEAINAIESFVAGVSEEEFLQNEEKRAAVERKLEIIGEAAKRLSQDFTELTNEIPWRSIAGTRDKIIHDYLTVDPKLIWRLATHDVLEVKKVVEKHIK